MSEEKAALAFAQSKPTEWEAFKAQWLKTNQEPTITNELCSVDSPLIEVVEPVKPKRKRQPIVEATVDV